MRIALLLLILLLPLVAGQNDTVVPDDGATDNGTADAGFQAREVLITINVAFAVLLTGAFVYVARR